MLLRTLDSSKLTMNNFVDLDTLAMGVWESAPTRSEEEEEKEHKF